MIVNSIQKSRETQSVLLRIGMTNTVSCVVFLPVDGRDSYVFAKGSFPLQKVFFSRLHATRSQAGIWMCASSKSDLQSRSLRLAFSFVS